MLFQNMTPDDELGAAPTLMSPLHSVSKDVVKKAFILIVWKVHLYVDTVHYQCKLGVQCTKPLIIL